MTDQPHGAPGRAHPADEETRYREALALDAVRADERAALLAALDDESWRVRSAAVERLAAVPDPAAVIPPLLALLDAGPTVGARDAAGSALARLGGAALPALHARLDDADPAKRLGVLAVLAAVADRRSVPTLTARLADADPNVRAAAAEALGRIGGPEATGALLAALDSDEATLRGAALDALGSLRVAPPVARVAPFLADRALRAGAYRALGTSDEPAALGLLAAGLAERTRSAREGALAAIGQQRARRGPGEVAPLAVAVRAVAAQGPGLGDACVEALGSEEPFVAAGALAVLGWLADVRHAGAVVRLAADERHRPLVEEALEALPRGTELLAALSRALPELSPLAQVTAYAALAAGGHASALQALVDRASDPDPHVQSEAIGALGRVGDPRAAPFLGGLLGDDAPTTAGVAASALTRIAQRSPEGRRAVLLECRGRAGAGGSAAIYRVLGAVGEAEDLRLVRDGLSAGDVVRRMAAAAAVAALGHRGFLRGEHVPELIAALADEAWAVRAAAARAFSDLALANAAQRLGDPAEGEHPLCAEAQAALVRSLGDREPAVRAAALEALGACGRPEHAPRIAEVAVELSTPPQVAVAAFHALTRLGAATPEVLERGLAHPDPEVVKEAVAACGQLPGEPGRRLLRAAAASERWDVRHAAARAMLGRGDPALAAEAARLAGAEPDRLVARAFAEAARVLGGGAGR